MKEEEHDESIRKPSEKQLRLTLDGNIYFSLKRPMKRGSRKIEEKKERREKKQWSCPGTYKYTYFESNEMREGKREKKREAIWQPLRDIFGSLTIPSIVGELFPSNV